MKCCEKCGTEIDTRDGINQCAECETIPFLKKPIAKIKRANAQAKRRLFDDAMESCGLVKVRGALGGTYWE